MADRLLDMVGQAGGPLADASLWHLEVVGVSEPGPDFRRLTFTAPGLDGLRFTAGQDLMFRVPRPDGALTNRRYTIRGFDASRAEVTVDVSLHGAGPGTDWVRRAGVGDPIDAIGPRGKVTPRLDAEWHLFVADDTGMPGALAMIEALPSTTTTLAVLEVDAPEDEQKPSGAPRSGSDIIWAHRSGRTEPGDPALLRGALERIELPAGDGQAYVSAESRVVRDLQALLIDRGLRPDQVSGKAYWRRGLPNADHGEPARQS
jgi:NADPH-dependent ferric siderophore reductase